LQLCNMAVMAVQWQLWVLSSKMTCVPAGMDRESQKKHTHIHRLPFQICLLVWETVVYLMHSKRCATVELKFINRFPGKEYFLYIMFYCDIYIEKYIAADKLNKSKLVRYARTCWDQCSRIGGGGATVNSCCCLQTLENMKIYRVHRIFNSLENKTTTYLERDMKLKDLHI
jgi:hypothetical protein